MKRKMLAIVLTMTLIVSLAACNTSNKTVPSSTLSISTPSSAASPTPEKKTDYPKKAVQMVIAAAAGGGTDLQIRAIAPFFKKYFGQELIPVAAPGGSGTIGMTQIADSKPDGYTLGVPYTGGVSIMPSYGKTTYNADSFKYICQYSNSPIVLAVNAKGSIKTVQDLIALGKKETVHYSCAAGGAIDLAIQAFAMKSGIKMVNVPVEGAAPAITNVLGNQVEVAGIHPTNIYAYIESKDLIPILTFESKRIPTLSDTPTAKEVGVEMVVSVWNGIAVPKDTPDEIVNILVEKFAQVFKDPDCIKAIEGLKATVDYLSPDDLKAKIAQEVKMFKELIQKPK